MTIVPTVDSVVSMATMGLPLDPPPTEEDIVGILDRLKAGFDLSDDLVEEAKRMLHARFAIRMELGQTIVGDDEHQPWLAARKAAIEPFYWSRYREFLIRAGWSPDVVRTLDRALDEILDLLGNPVERHPWKRRGLVVGDVPVGQDRHLRRVDQQGLRRRVPDGDPAYGHAGERPPSDPGTA